MTFKAKKKAISVFECDRMFELHKKTYCNDPSLLILDTVRHSYQITVNYRIKSEILTVTGYRWSPFKQVSDRTTTLIGLLY